MKKLILLLVMSFFHIHISACCCFSNYIKNKPESDEIQLVKAVILTAVHHEDTHKKYPTAIELKSYTDINAQLVDVYHDGSTTNNIPVTVVTIIQATQENCSNYRRNYSTTCLPNYCNITTNIESRYYFRLR